jgi:hypothetical protein
MYTDMCMIQNKTRSAQFGEIENTALEFESVCRVERMDKAVHGATGTMIKYSRLYFLPADVSISKGDSIKVTMERGVKIDEEYLDVEEVFPIGGFYPHHLEVYVV